MGVTTTYREIEITLLEDANQWRAVINGRERSFETLPKARESIDKSLANIAKKSVPAFAQFDVWQRVRYGNGFARVTITSFAEGRGYDRHRYAWVNKDGKRSKESLATLFPINETNNELAAQIMELEMQSQKIDEQIGELAKKLEVLAPPNSDES